VAFPRPASQRADAGPNQLRRTRQADGRARRRLALGQHRSGVHRQPERVYTLLLRARIQALPDGRKFSVADEIYCQCHQSVYDPFSVIQESFVALPRPEGD
jgi:site-specific DNA-cytosine methylase